MLGVLSSEGLITLERVMHDGTKIKANASRHKAMSYERMKVLNGKYKLLRMRYLKF